MRNDGLSFGQPVSYNGFNCLFDNWEDVTVMVYGIG